MFINVQTIRIFIIILGSTPVTTISQSTYNKKNGKQIILGCSVSSSNSPIQQLQCMDTNQYVAQVIDHILVSTSYGKYSGSTTSSPSLTIHNVASTDEGAYSCKARNLVGTSRNNPTTTLTVTSSRFILCCVSVLVIILKNKDTCLLYGQNETKSVIVS